MSIKHPKMKLHKMQQTQLERVKNLENKESEMQINQDTKRTGIEMKKKNNTDDLISIVRKDDDVEKDDDIKKPEMKLPEYNFGTNLNEGRSYAPEPYQYLPTFDEKELVKEYNVNFVFI